MLDAKQHVLIGPRLPRPQSRPVGSVSGRRLVSSPRPRQSRERGCATNNADKVFSSAPLYHHRTYPGRRLDYSNNGRRSFTLYKDTSFAGCYSATHAVAQTDATAPPFQLKSAKMESPEVVPSPEEPHVHTLFETSTGTWQWVVADPATKEAVIIDPVLDSNQGLSISTNAADRILELIRHYNYRCVRILETHNERTQRTSSWYLRTQLRDEKGQSPRICTGKSISGVQRMFARQYRQHPEWSKHFETAFRDGQIFHIGHLPCQVLQLRSDSFAFVIGHNVFIGEVPQEDSMKRLTGYTTGFHWHPGGGDSSRPTTAATIASDWPGSRPSTSLSAVSPISPQPYSPLGSAASRRTNQTSARPASHIHEMSA